MKSCFSGNSHAQVPLFNVNLDEPFDLGRGKSKEQGKSKLEAYCEYVHEMHDIVLSLQAQDEKVFHMMMWADVVSAYGEKMIERLPKQRLKLLEVSFAVLMLCNLTTE